MTLEKQLLSIENNLEYFQYKTENISEKEVAWHLDHILRVIYNVLKQLKQSNPNDYKWQFNKLKSVVFLTRYIPRGKGKAPKQVTNNAVINKKDLIDLLDKTKKQVQALHNLSKKSNFKHHLFGLLNKKETLLFLKIHTQHHLKIVRDIVNAQA